MINIIVAYDDNDLELGDFFELAFNDLRDNLSNVNNITIKPIRGLNCTENYVLEQINSFDEEIFGFVGLSHGNNSQLLTENDIYVDVNNLVHFEKTLFYSTACSTGEILGKTLIDNNCFSYVGFIEESYASYEDFYDIYIECENYCLKEFLLSSNTIEQSFNNMIKHYNDKVLELVNKDEILVAMELSGNRDIFVLYGDTTLTKLDLE